MKSLSLLVCLAAPAAFAAELKDPAIVSREWQQMAAQARFPLGSSRNLTELSDSLTITPLERMFSPDNLPPPLPPSRPKHLDAPSYKIPDQLPNIRPRGAIPWEYNGEVYWLVPLSVPAGK